MRIGYIGRWIGFVGLMVFILLPPRWYMPEETGPSESDAPAPGMMEIRMTAWAMTPSRSMKVSPGNRFPRRALADLAREWEAMHPGVKLRFLRSPGGGEDYFNWLRAQFSGGIAPDIVYLTPPGNEWMRNGWVLPLDRYLNEPNPYIPGNRRWRDSFLPAAMDPRMHAEDGRMYFIPVNLVTVFTVYNKDIFKKVGIRHPPETWKEFLEVQGKIQKAGFVPFWSDWMWSAPRFWFGAWLYPEPESTRRLDVLKKDGVVDTQELCRALKKGILGVYQARFREYLRLMKEWSRYWPKGFTLIPYKSGATSLFPRGRLAMRWIGIWEWTPLIRDRLRTFEIGVMKMPVMTKESSPYATHARPRFGAVAGDNYFVTDTARKRGTVDLCIDFLRFLTTPEHDTMLTQEETAIKYYPSVKGARLHPELEPLREFIYPNRSGLEIFWGPDAESQKNMDRVLEMYLMDLLSEKEALELLDKWLIIGVENTIRRNQLPGKGDRWDLSRW